MPGRFHNLELEQHASEIALLTEKREFEPDEYLRNAATALHRTQYEIALQMYTRCLERSRTVIPAWVGQVQMLVMLGEHREARLWADKALELFTNNGELMAAKAQACARLSDRKASFACSDGSLQAPGSSPWRWQVRGEVLLAAGEPHYDACFTKALQERSADWFDRIIIARIYLYYRRATNALAYAKAALDVNAAAAAAWFEMGNCQAQLALLGAAHSSYARCLELQPDFIEARRALEALKAMPLSQRVRRWLRLGGKG